MRINPSKMSVTWSPDEADFVSERLTQLMDAHDTSSVAFMWDPEGEVWIGIAMWGDLQSEDGSNGVNFLIDAETAAVITGIFVSMQAAEREMPDE